MALPGTPWRQFWASASVPRLPALLCPHGDGRNPSFRAPGARPTPAPRAYLSQRRPVWRRRWRAVPCAGTARATAPGLLRPAPVSDVIVLHYNYTGKLRGARYQPGAGLRAAAAAAVGLAVRAAVVLENLAVLLALARRPRFRAPIFLLLGSLALSDLLAGAAYAANILLSGPLTLRLSPALWFAHEGGVLVALAASVLSLLAIALERHLAVARRGPAARRPGRTRALAAAAWGAALALGLLPALGWNCLGRLEACSTLLPLYAKPYVLCCVLAFAGPLAAIGALYARVCWRVRAHARPALLRTLGAVLLALALCWGPLFLLLALDVACPARACPVLLHADPFLGLAMANSLLNPLLYALIHRPLRQALLPLLRCPAGAPGSPAPSAGAGASPAGTRPTATARPAAPRRPPCAGTPLRTSTPRGGVGRIGQRLEGRSRRTADRGSVGTSQPSRLWTTTRVAVVPISGKRRRVARAWHPSLGRLRQEGGKVTPSPGTGWLDISGVLAPIWDARARA
ncbi:LOW QUALITY PROTEIN: sphingosine 1-phosphate receptor 5 [Ctenodactylus gundi]